MTNSTEITTLITHVETIKDTFNFMKSKIIMESLFHLNNVIGIWGLTSAIFKKLLIPQKKAVKCIDFRDSCKEAS